MYDILKVRSVKDKTSYWLIFEVGNIHKPVMLLKDHEMEQMVRQYHEQSGAGGQHVPKNCRVGKTLKT